MRRISVSLLSFILVILSCSSGLSQEIQVIRHNSVVTHLKDTLRSVVILPVNAAKDLSFREKRRLMNIRRQLKAAIDSPILKLNQVSLNEKIQKSLNQKLSPYQDSSARKEFAKNYIREKLAVTGIKNISTLDSPGNTWLRSNTCACIRAG